MCVKCQKKCQHIQLGININDNLAYIECILCTRHYVKYFTSVVLFHEACEMGFLNGLLQMRKWRFWEIKKIDQGHETRKQGSQASNLRSSTPQSNHLYYDDWIKTIK